MVEVLEALIVKWVLQAKLTKVLGLIPQVLHFI